MIAAGGQNEDSLTRIENSPDRNKSVEDLEIKSP